MLLLAAVVLMTTRVQAQENANATVATSEKDQFLPSGKLTDFVFTDTLGQAVKISDFKGKYVLVDLFFTGCGACIGVAEALRDMHDSLKNETMVFLSVSTDKSRSVWLQSVRENAIKSNANPWAGMYAARKGTVLLYTGGSGNENDFCRKFVPNKFYPKLLLFDPNGKVLSEGIPRPDKKPLLFIDYIRKVM